MSSLLQSRGRIRGGEVELLMYLQRDVETPANCQECGQPYIAGERCTGCQRLITHIFRVWPRGNDQRDSMEVFKSWLPEQTAAVAAGTEQTCYVANRWSREDVEPQELVLGHRGKHVVPKLYRIWRKPVGMCGAWVQFNWGGQTHVPDLSVPIAVLKLPRDAKPLTPSEAIAYWLQP